VVYVQNTKVGYRCSICGNKWKRDRSRREYIFQGERRGGEWEWGGEHNGLGRASVERVNSRLELVGLGDLKLRGLRNVMGHVVLCIVAMLLVAVAALGLGRPWKARSVSSFWW